jgi:hypothetical protein
MRRSKMGQREVFDETGSAKEDIEFGPQVWIGELDLMLKARAMGTMGRGFGTHIPCDGWIK